MLGQVDAMRTQVLIIGVLSVLLAGCTSTTSRVSVADIGRRAIVIGGLERPVGQEITIHGHKLSLAERNGPLEEGSFLVDAVDGQNVGGRVVVRVRGIHDWPGGTAATIRGYEVGTIRFERIEDANYGPDDPRFKPHQVIWMFFEPVEVVEPKMLKIGGEVWSFLLRWPTRRLHLTAALPFRSRRQCFSVILSALHVPPRRR